MKIVYTLPGIAAHGGHRVIIEHCNRLQEMGHEVAILCSKPKKPDWIRVNKWIKFTDRLFEVRGYDVAVICSPHHIRQAKDLRAKKTFIFCQMHEALFKPTDKRWQELCKEFYTAPYPMLSISKWNVEIFTEQYARPGGTTHQITNGINFDDFPIVENIHKKRVILLESPEPTNAAKDVDRIALRCAEILKDEGYKIIGFGRTPITPEFEDVIEEYIINPTLSDMNRMYSEAMIMIKATKYDARSTSPIEAMTKGCVTVRGIEKGDEDLVEKSNCLRSSYDFEKVLTNCYELLHFKAMRETIAKNCIEYVKTNCDWNPIMKRIETIYQS